jgi:hypothetical protein
MEVQTSPVQLTSVPPLLPLLLPLQQLQGA